MSWRGTVTRSGTVTVSLVLRFFQPDQGEDGWDCQQGLGIEPEVNIPHLMKENKSWDESGEGQEGKLS